MARQTPAKDPWDSATREALLQHRVPDVYAAFQRYRLHGRIEPDVFAPDGRPLLAAPLHELPVDAFRIYQWKAMTTWGTEEHFKHFLPRMLELVVDPDETYPSLDAGMVLEKVCYGEWRTWPKDEQHALEALFDALWGALLMRAARKSLHDWLRALAQCFDDLLPFLHRWETEAADPDHGLTPAAHLAEFALYFDGGGFNAVQKAQAVEWLTSEPVLQLLESAYFRWSSSPHAAALSAGHERLAAWKPSDTNM